MLEQGFIKKVRAVDIPQYKNSGWQIVPHRAFKNIDPAILAGLDPLPVLDRPDYKQYLDDNNIPYDF